jgi:hypothetical protein
MDWFEWLGLVVGSVALVFAYLAWRVSVKQFRLAEEQAELRPNLEVSLREVGWHYLPPDSSVPHEQVAITFNITNKGRTAAHGVRCTFLFEEQRLGAPHPNYGKNRDFEKQYIGPIQTAAHDVTRSVREYGSTKARYVCTCDEVGPTDGVVEVEVPNRDPE